jgi:prepilin-type N-terminal cleavage/methylation domain-containing protein
MRSPPGFTLMEVLVALVVTALLASSLLALQQHGMNQARDGDVLWDHVNLAQEALLGQELARMHDDTGWRWPAQHANRQWRINPAPALRDRPGPWVVLVTRTPERTLEWYWPGDRP